MQNLALAPHNNDAPHPYVQKAIATHDFLTRQSDFSPRNAELNCVLSSFVTDTMRPRSDEEVGAILRSPELKKVVPQLRQLLNRAEFEMECFCAAAMTGKLPEAERKYASFRDFIYKDNYHALVDLEMQAMGWPLKQPALDREKQSVAFVGAGPLPISAILLHLRTGLPVTCIDSDAEACRLGQNLIRHLAKHQPGLESLADNMRYAHVAGDKHDYITHPVVFIASLVDRKDPVIFRIIESSNTGATVVVRSAEGLSSLLYAPHECEGGQEDYNLYFSKKTATCPSAINSSLVYKLPSGKLRTRNKIDYAGEPEDLHAVRPRRRDFRRALPGAIPI